MIRHIHREGSLSRAQLAQRTHLNKATVSSLVEELIDLGLIHESGIDTFGFGRPATMLNLNPGAGYIIGVEIGVGFISIILTNFVGKIIWQQFEELNSILNQDEITTRIFHYVDDVRKIAYQDGKRLLGMGLALPGMVDVDQGVLIFSPNLRWRDVPLRQMFSDYSGLPVFVDNHANAAAMGEHLFGTALGLGLANLINIFNPQMVVIGGSLSNVGKYMLPAIEEVIQERTLEVMLKPIEIQISAFGSNASVMGAVALVVQEILSKPEVVNL